MAQASSTVRILALCKSFALLRPAPPPSLRTPYSCPAKRINGADNGRGTWRLWEMSTRRGGEHASGREGERGSASSTVVKFHLSTNQLPNSCRRVLPLTMLRSLSYSRFPPLLPSFPFPAFPFPVFVEFFRFLLVMQYHRVVSADACDCQKGKKKRSSSKERKNAKRQNQIYKIVKLNKNRENIFAPLMQLRCCCCREANLQCPPLHLPLPVYLPPGAPRAVPPG